MQSDKTNDTLPLNGYNTLKKRKLIKAIPEARTLREAGIKAGYTDTSVNIYRKAIKRHIKQSFEAMGYDEVSIKKEFERLSALAEKKNDLSNAMRGKENIARICGYFKDKQEITNKQAPDLSKSSSDMKQEILSRLGIDDTLNVKPTQE